MSQFYKKVEVAWKATHSNADMPCQQAPPVHTTGWLPSPIGFIFEAAVFENLGGRSDGTAHPLLPEDKCVDLKQGSNAKIIYNRVYKKLSYSIW